MNPVMFRSGNEVIVSPVMFRSGNEVMGESCHVQIR